MGCKQDILCGKRVIIGIRDYAGCEKPESGLFINDIPGIKIKNAAAVADPEHKSGIEFLKIIINQAILHAFQDFTNQMSPLFKYNAIAEIRKVNYWDGSIIPQANLDRGLVLKRWRSELAEITVDEVFFKCTASGTVQIKIIDGSHTETVEITAVANEEVRLRVDYTAKSEQIRIVANNATFGVYSGKIDQTLTGCINCGHGSSSKGFYITGWDGLKEIPKYYGVGVKASVRCNEDNLICMLLKKMGFIFWYKAGALYYEELLNSTRLNAITLVQKDRAEENLAMLNEKYTNAYAAFRPTIDALIKSTKGECMPCNPSIKYVQTIP